MGLRDLGAYPAQEAFSEIGAKYHVRVRELGAGIRGDSFPYGDDPYQEVAVFAAPDPNGTVVAFMHGGGWTNGYKEWMTFMAPPLTAAGITFVSMGYRLAPAVTWPSGVRDAAAGGAWIHKNIAA
ncbi:MAG: alpha/beta hydrolase, partial [Proteobacteria bacterium]|nr:alpha/beta hydrolase [Pseudomonadota bacterium]